MFACLLIRLCSVSSIYLEDLARTTTDYSANDTDDNTSYNFTFPKISNRYKKRSTDLENTNLYTFCAKHWYSDGRKTVPQFFGYNDKATWASTKRYTRYTLILFKPWRGDVKGESKTFADAFEQFMYDPCFPV